MTFEKSRQLLQCSVQSVTFGFGQSYLSEDHGIVQLE